MKASEAIRHSCNVYYYETGYRLSLDAEGDYDANLGLDKLATYADMFGLTEKSGIEITESTPQVSDELPVLSAIGQGTNSFTTAGLARYVTTIANDGTCYNLTLLDKLTDANGKILKEYNAEVRNEVEISEQSWNTIHSGMKAAMENSTYFKELGVSVAGKTGTAQENVKRADHALFIGYAPFDNPEIAVSCRVCYGYSSGFASQTAAMVFDYYFTEDKTEFLEDEAVEVDASQVENEH